MQSGKKEDPTELVRQVLRLTSAPSPAIAARLLGAVRGHSGAPRREEPLWDVRFAVLDLETSGLETAACEILEAAVCTLTGGRVVESFTTLVRPRGRIPAEVQALTGIDDSMVAGAPGLGEALEELRRRLDGCVLVAHNAAFDQTVLDRALVRTGHGTFPGPVVCTRRLARRVRPDLRHRDLDALCQAYDIPNRARHRAGGDAEATARLFTELLRAAESMGAATLGGLLELLERRPGPGVDFARYAFGPAFLAHLPRSPGIYRMRDRAGEILYVGKARDLRARVRSYFAGRARGRVAALREALHDIEVCPTDSELEALLREQAEIRSLQPRFNVQVQVFRRAFYLKVRRPSGRARIVSVQTPEASEGCFGPFIDPLGGRAVARLWRRALSVALHQGVLGLDPEPMLARGEGAEPLIAALGRELAARNGAGDTAGGDELRRMLGALRRVLATAAGPTRAFHRRDLVVRLPSLGAAKLFVVREGLPLELFEARGDDDVERIARAIEALPAGSARSERDDEDGLKILDAWLARHPPEACLDLGDVVDPGGLREGLRRLLAAAPPGDLPCPSLFAALE